MLDTRRREVVGGLAVTCWISSHASSLRHTVQPAVRYISYHLPPSPTSIHSPSHIPINTLSLIQANNMSRRTTIPEQPPRPSSLGSCILYGCGAGLLGVAA